MNLDDWLIQNENLTVEEINEILRGKKATYSDGEEFIIKEFNEEDAYSFARHVHIQAKPRGEELQFLTCPYCHGGKSGKDKGTFSINLRSG